MKEYLRRPFCCAMALVTVLSLAACGGKTVTETVPDSNAAEITSTEPTQVFVTAPEVQKDMFTSRDFDENTENCEVIDLSARQDDCVTIAQGGNYLLTGQWEGQILVDAGEEKVQLVLSDAVIHNGKAAAIRVESADKVFVTLAEGTKNRVSSDAGEDAALFARCDLTLNGTGTLEVQSAGHGILSKDDLKITNGTYYVTAGKRTLSGGNSVRIAAGTFSLNAGTDAIHTSHEDSEKGYIYIEDGVFFIEALSDGLDASGDVTIAGGSFEITAGGGVENAAEKQNSSFGMGGQDLKSRGNGEMPMKGEPGAFMQNRRSGERPQMPENFSPDMPPEAPSEETRSEEPQSDTQTGKAVKAGGNLVISGGVLNLNASDDAIHADGNLDVYGGELVIASGDDGIHGGGDTSVYGGSIVVSQSYEGLEGGNVFLYGGTLSLTASDDGVNAAGGDGSGFGLSNRDGFRSDGGNITICGGTVYVNAEGDGIDANGELIVSGGSVVVDGPSRTGNGALDYGTGAQITGGSVLAFSGGNMEVNFTSASQGAALVNVGSYPAGTKVELRDEDGKIILSGTSAKSFSTLNLSAPSMEQGKTYTLTVGVDTQSITLSELIAGSGNAMGMGKHQGGMMRK